jgi:hypothetical protein
MMKSSKSQSPEQEISHRKLWEKRKYFAKDDLLYLQDHCDIELPKDKFKDNRNLSKNDIPVQEKVTKLSVFPGYKISSELRLATNSQKKEYKFTTTEVKFRPKNCKFEFKHHS